MGRTLTMTMSLTTLFSGELYTDFLEAANG